MQVSILLEYLTSLRILNLGKMIKTEYYEFGKVSIFDKFLVVIMNEGVNVIPEYNDKLIDIAKEYYSNRYFGYITYRKNSYSVNPLTYIETSKIENLVGLAVVCPEECLMLRNVEIEKHFSKKPIQDFKHLDDAKNWILELVKKESENLKE